MDRPGATVCGRGDLAHARRVREPGGPGRQRRRVGPGDHRDRRVLRVPNWLARSCATRTDDIELGRLDRLLMRGLVSNSGSPMASSTAAVSTAVTAGRRCTSRARRAKKPTSESSPRAIRARARRDGRIRLRAKPTRAAVLVSATSMAISAMDTPAAPSAVIEVTPNANRPSSEPATVRAENTMVRPADDQALTSASLGCVTVTQLLAVPRDQQQTVVDRQAQAQQRDHDRGVLVEVGDLLEAQQRGERGEHRQDRGEHRQAGGDDPAEHEDQHDQGDRQRQPLGRCPGRAATCLLTCSPDDPAAAGEHGGTRSGRTGPQGHLERVEARGDRVHRGASPDRRPACSA